MSHTIEGSRRRRPESARWPMIVTGAVMTAGYINNRVSEHVYGWNKDTQINTLPYDGPHVLAAGVAFPGMGNIGNGGEQMAQQMSAASPIKQPWSYVAYDNLKELTIESLGKCLKDKQEDLGFQYMDGYYSSMGFPIGMAAAREAGIPLRVIFINSSPLKTEHGYGHRWGNIAEKLPDLGVVGKFAGVLFADTIRPKMKESKLRHAGREAIWGGSQTLFGSQFKLVQEIDLEKNWKNYAGIIHPDHTRVIFASPPAGKDNTIRVGESYISIKNWFARFGVNVERVEMPDAEHADTEKSIKYGQDAINKAYEETQHLLLAA